MEEEICRNYLSHHQNTHWPASDRSLGLSYHARLCDYRILPYLPKSKDSKPKGMQIRIPRNILIHPYPILISQAHLEIMMAQRVWMSGTVNSNISDINSQHSLVTYIHIRCKTSFQTHHYLHFITSIQFTWTRIWKRTLPVRYQYVFSLHDTASLKASINRLKKVTFKFLESLEEKVVSATEMHAMEMKCCLQRLQMASYLRHKSSWNNGYSNPLVCHAVHKSIDFRPQEFEIRLRYKDNSMITVQIFYKTNTECLLRILWN